MQMHIDEFAPRFAASQTKAPVFLHPCSVCGSVAPFGVGVRLTRGQLGRWFCAEHRPRKRGPDECEQ